MTGIEREQGKVCGNCNLFQIQEEDITATVIGTGEQIKSGIRNCSAKNIAWSDCPCPTGEFTPKP